MGPELNTGIGSLDDTEPIGRRDLPPGVAPETSERYHELLYGLIQCFWLYGLRWRNRRKVYASNAFACSNTAGRQLCE